ncbi:hypothetical protein [Streptomyces sp. NPDC127105]|uniref:hypothetical protein n=1 Tax=Streptomyces sp. NPDC127105 TaxID=3345359 RepID=UPI003660FA04
MAKTTSTTPAEDLAALQQRILAGDTKVTPTQLAAAEAAATHEKLWEEGERARAEQEAEAERQVQLKQLHNEIDEYAAAHSGEQLAKLYSAAVDSLTTFVAELYGRNRHISMWASRMRDLGVTALDRPGTEEQDDAGLAYHSQGVRIYAGDRRMSHLSESSWVGYVLAAVRNPRTGAPVKFEKQSIMGKDPAERLRRLDRGVQGKGRERTA